MERICSKCKETKPEALFSLRNKVTGKRHSVCKQCQSVHSRKYYENNTEKHKANAFRLNKQCRDRNSQYVIDYLSTHGCVDCGESDPVILEFDHLDQTTKREAISNLVRSGVSLQTLQTEIDKCEIRCANCHRRKTAKQLGWKIWASSLDG